MATISSQTFNRSGILYKTNLLHSARRAVCVLLASNVASASRQWNRGVAGVCLVWLTAEFALHRNCILQCYTQKEGTATNTSNWQNCGALNAPMHKQ